MRNKVQLYIGGKRADLDDGSFLLLNYTAEDLSNPTIVKNSFSRQITLKGTPTNDEIFGHIYRNDRITQYGGGSVGPDFDPTRKTPFTIYNEAGEILESGYLKLDGIERTRRKWSYKVTLYGGLGSFLYGLAYKTDGTKRTLADLAFGETLDFIINRTAVADAWARLDGDTSKAAKWDIINFAPAYNGKPGKPFDANKAIVHAATAGLPVKDGDYGTANGLSLVTLNSEVTEQEAKDYRSYLQRPVLKMKPLINAICDPANNGGYTVNLDAEFFDAANPYWEDLWMTLPKLTDLNIDEASTSGTVTTTGTIFNIPGGGDISKTYSINLRLEIETVLANGLSPNTDFVMHCEDDWAAGMSPDDSPGFYLNYFEITLDVKDSNDTVIKTIVYRVSTMQAPEYYDQMDEVFDYLDTGGFYKNGSIYRPTFFIQENGVAKIEVAITPKAICWGNLRANSDPMQVFPVGSYDYDDAEAVTNFHLDYDDCLLTYMAVASSTVRTGAAITQTALLSGDHTPADYLLSYCKTFGIQIVAHKDEKVVDLILRKNFYGASVIDLSGRIDRGKAVSKAPFAFDSRWYLFGNGAKGEFAEYYANKYGRPFGQYRVNTGYEFDAGEKNYSNIILADSVATNEDYAKRAVELGHTVISSCEHGTMGNVRECYDLAKKYGLKWRYVAEAYFVKDRFAEDSDGRKDRKNCHIILAAKTAKGMGDLNEVLSEANISGYYFRPRVDMELLMKLDPKDVFVTSACIAGIWAYGYSSNKETGEWSYDFAEPDRLVKQLHAHFGDSFMLEVQPHNVDKQKIVNIHILNLYRKEGIKIIAGMDSHFIYPEEAELRRMRLEANHIVYEDEEGWSLDYPSDEEAVRRFEEQGVLSAAQIKEAMDNTNVFLDFEDIEFDKGRKLPTIYPNLTQEERNQKYRDLVYAKWDEYKQGIPPERWPEYEAGIEYEVNTITSTNTSDYFLLDYEWIQKAKSMGGQLTRTGRGSASGHR